MSLLKTKRQDREADIGAELADERGGVWSNSNDKASSSTFIFVPWSARSKVSQTATVL